MEPPRHVPYGTGRNLRTTNQRTPVKTRAPLSHSARTLTRSAGLLSLLPALAAHAQTPPPSPANDEVLQLSKFTVTSEANTGYDTAQTTSGLRIVQELKNVANSIS